ncbi:MAG: energy transducer TonB [Blastocatellia bacterium]
MQTSNSTKQRLSPTSLQVCAAALIALFIFAQHPLATSTAQSEDAKDKKPAPTPTSALQADSFSLRPTITYREKAKYTEEARDNVTHGTVALNVVFRSNGSISDIRVISGLPDGLVESAIDAAQKVRFEPGIKDGQPVSVRGTLEFVFHLYGLGESSIRRMLRNDFPLLSEGVVQVMATEAYKRGDRDTEKAWRYGKQCLEKGVSKLPQSEQEELTNLTLEAIRGLNESDQQIYQKLMDKSKTEQLRDYEEMRVVEFRFRGTTRLPDEKRKRAEAIYNKAATLGTEIP